MHINKFVSVFLVAVMIAAVFSCKPDKEKDGKTTKEKQEKQEKEKQDTEPEEKAEPEVRTYSIPDKVPYYKESDEFLTNKFLPIGWSKHGNFAYITEYADEACGCYTMQFNIVGPKAIDTLWTFEFQSMEYKQTLPDVWKNKKQQIQEKLNQYGIIQKDNFQIMDPEFTVSGKKYDISLETKTEKDPYFGFDVVKEGRITLHTPQGKKHVHTFTEPSPSLILGAMVYGALKSPYEERIMIIYKRERRGYEGPPHVVTFKLAGTQL